jgi:hypothetical protein
LHCTCKRRVRTFQCHRTSCGLGSSR